VDAEGPRLSRVRGAETQRLYREVREGKSAEFAKKNNVWRDSCAMHDEIVTIGFVKDDASFIGKRL